MLACVILFAGAAGQQVLQGFRPEIHQFTTAHITEFDRNNLGFVLKGYMPSPLEPSRSTFQNSHPIGQ